LRRKTPNFIGKFRRESAITQTVKMQNAMNYNVVMPNSRITHNRPQRIHHHRPHPHLE
jgi:hypothetical protein